VLLKPRRLPAIRGFMFTRSMSQTADMDAQHQLLNRVAGLPDAATLSPTINSHNGAKPSSAAISGRHHLAFVRNRPYSNSIASNTTPALRAASSSNVSRFE